MTKIFFATDLHGSERCWKKFINAGKFYGASVSILGGDMTGKAIIPIIREKRRLWRVTFLEQEFTFNNQFEVEEMEATIRDRGYYPVRLEKDQLQELSEKPEMIDQMFNREAVKTIAHWVEWAEPRLKRNKAKIYVCPGNDDMFCIDEILDASEMITVAEGKVLELDNNHLMLSTGWTNTTPWNTFRECSEDELKERMQAMISQVNGRGRERCVYNFHCPPYGWGIDEAPELDEQLRPKYAGRSLVPVGSTAVAEVIEATGPVLGLFGHIHEGKGAIRRAGTVCINPGSMYEQGILQGALVELSPEGVENYLLTSG